MQISVIVSHMRNCVPTILNNTCSYDKSTQAIIKRHSVILSEAKFEAQEGRVYIAAPTPVKWWGFELYIATDHLNSAICTAQRYDRLPLGQVRRRF
jgi:hypothetical protein